MLFGLRKPNSVHRNSRLFVQDANGNVVKNKRGNPKVSTWKVMWFIGLIIRFFLKKDIKRLAKLQDFPYKLLHKSNNTAHDEQQKLSKYSCYSVYVYRCNILWEWIIVYIFAWLRSWPLVVQTLRSVSLIFCFGITVWTAASQPLLCFFAFILFSNSLLWG